MRVPHVNKHFIIRSLWVVSLLTAFFMVYPEFVKINTFSIIALLTLPISLGHSQQPKNGLVWIILGLGILGLIIPTTTGIFVYLTLFIALILAGKNSISSLPAFVHIGLITPLFHYINNLISFPLRISLSQVTSWLLSPFWQTNSTGNIIIIDGNEYLVDQACAGLFMLKYGILFGTLLLSWKLKSNRLSRGKILGYYTFLHFLILSANIVRIIILVLGDIGANHWLHETIGLAIYALVVLWPFYGLVNAPKQIKKGEKTYTPIYAPKIQLSVLSLLYLFLLLQNDVTVKASPIQQSHLPGYSRTVLESGVWQFEKSDALIYIKPPVAGYRSDHNPMICWAGSGFEFKKINQKEINGHTIHISELQKEDKKLYSAWWFESDKHRTNNQWTWRKYALTNNEKFHLINLTCNDPKTLHTNLKILLDEKSIFIY